MNHIPDIVGYKLNSALNVLDRYKNEIIIKETFGKKGTKSDEPRILRQLVLKDDILQLTIGYF